MQFDSVQCNWQILDAAHKTVLGVSLIIFGALGVLLNLWLLITFLRSTLLVSRQYLFVLAYCIACLARGLLAGFPVTALAAFANKWILGDTSCHFFAFFQLLLGIFQMCCLSALAIERYLVLRFYMKGREMSFKAYVIGLICSWILALLIAICPLIGIGRYYCDMTDTICGIDWRTIYTKHLPFNTILIVFLGVFPIIFSIICLCLSISKEKRLLNERSYTTKAVAITTALTYLFWTPKAVLIIFTAFGLHINKAILVLSSISSEAALIIPVLTYLIYEPTIRKALVMTFFNDICVKFRRPRRRPQNPSYRWSAIRN